MADISKININNQTYDLKDALARTTSYTLSIASTAWSGSGSSYSYTWSNTSLRANYPPIITCTDIDNTNYNYITNATATAGQGIVFQATSRPSGAINLIIIDLG